ncbi:hypothetical protein BH09BAC2_BH09BAC2_11240 [soil metagenome]
MSGFELVFLVLFIFTSLGIAWLVFEVLELKKRPINTGNADTKNLQLQAYERLSLLTERISLQNLISRHPNSGLSAKEMKSVLIENIRSEFDHNVTQQIYVTSDAWRAVNNNKEQNIYVINQLAASLPLQATGMDLSKHIVDYLLHNPKGNLSTVVAEVLNFEAKKLM